MKKKISELLATLPVQLLCRFIIGGVFIYAAMTKITHLNEFARIIYNYKILPEMFVYFAAMLLPWVEMFAGIFVIAGIYKRTAAIIISGMLLIFIIAISFNLMRGLNFDCGCFSPEATESGSDPVALLIRDIILMIPAAVVIFFSREKEEQKEIPTGTAVSEA